MLLPVLLLDHVALLLVMRQRAWDAAATPHKSCAAATGYVSCAVTCPAAVCAVAAIAGCSCAGEQAPAAQACSSPARPTAARGQLHGVSSCSAALQIARSQHSVRTSGACSFHKHQKKRAPCDRHNPGTHDEHRSMQEVPDSAQKHKPQLLKVLHSTTQVELLQCRCRARMCRHTDRPCMGQAAAGPCTCMHACMHQSWKPEAEDATSNRPPFLSAKPA